MNAQSRRLLPHRRNDVDEAILILSYGSAHGRLLGLAGLG